MITVLLSQEKREGVGVLESRLSHGQLKCKRMTNLVQGFQQHTLCFRIPPQSNISHGLSIQDFKRRNRARRRELFKDVVGVLVFTTTLEKIGRSEMRCLQ